MHRDIYTAAYLAGNITRQEADRQRAHNRERLAELERETDERRKRMRMVARLNYRKGLN